MFKRFFATMVLGVWSWSLMSAQTAGLAGKLDGDTYVSATGEFKVPSPVLTELGGKISDTANVVTFSDSYNTHVSIACFPQNPTQIWEQDTRGLRDYLLYFFTDFVLADFNKRFPGSKVESARFLPEFHGGALIAYALLPGGSLFEQKSPVGASPAEPIKAKRGTLLFVRNRHIYVLSIELAERVTQRSSYDLTVEKENSVLAERLTTLCERLVFLTKPRS
ncbi:hypothetical protein [Oleiharenicola lentus]|uniref:hypothetical protein n=1 Tax=Oleiharenicola lentus TaxID=2508720 RepID=UPI003F6706FA